MKRIIVSAAVLLWSGTSLFADFSYEQSSKITGGAMAGMMKVAGVFSRQAREPIRTSVLVKGDRMANFSPKSAQVIDLGKETVTDIDFDKKTYSVVTFAQWTEAMKALEAKMSGKRDESGASVTFKPSVSETGQSRTISGMNARQVILKIDMETKDAKSGNTGTMTITSDMWLAEVAGYQEVREFYQRMAQKLNWSPNSGMLASAAGSSKGMAELVKEASKLNGVPVYQVMKMGAAVPPGQAGAEQAQAQPPQQQQEQQAEAEQPSAGGALGRLAGGRFGLGGFGRKKKQEQPPAAQPASGQPAQGAPDASGALMEVTTELSSFSSSAVDGSKFEVPAGFKQVESEMVKNSRR